MQIIEVQVFKLVAMIFWVYGVIQQREEGFSKELIIIILGLLCFNMSMTFSY